MRSAAASVTIKACFSAIAAVLPVSDIAATSRSVNLIRSRRLIYAFLCRGPAAFRHRPIVIDSAAIGAQPGGGGGQRVDCEIDIGRGGEAAEAEPDRRIRQIVGKAKRAQHIG